LRFQTFASSCFGVRHLPRGSGGAADKPFAAIACHCAGNPLATIVLVESEARAVRDLPQQAEARIDHG
jgi:hypothetical protein